MKRLGASEKAPQDIHKMDFLQSIQPTIKRDATTTIDVQIKPQIA